MPALLATLLSAAAALAAPPTSTAQDTSDAKAMPAPDPYVQVHVWGTAFDQDVDEQADPAGYGDPEDDPGFKIRRARIGFGGANDKWLYSVIIGQSAPFDGIDAAQGAARVDIVDAHAGYSPVEDLYIIAGVQKVPISRELIMSSQRLALVERSAASQWLIPGRDTGLLANYRVGSETTYGLLTAGLFNGNGSLITDDNLGKMVAARAEFVTGAADPYRTLGKKEGVTFALAADFWQDNDVATSTTGVGVDTILRVGPLSVTAEGRLADIAPGDTTVDEPGVLAETRRLGGLAQIGYTIKRYEPAVRFSYFDDEVDADNNGDVGDLVAGVTWNGPDATNRIGLGYIHRFEFGGTEIANDSVRLWWLMRL